MKSHDYFQERKNLILGIVVDNYIKTVTPVSSGFITRRYPLDLSSATIRNILSELEEEGYLTHPHTSAGRIPTQLGYRYYVDRLMRQIQLLEDEKQRIRKEYETQISELENLLEKTSEVISDLTNYTSIISIDGCPDKLFYRGASYVVNYPEADNLNKIKHILYALEEKERILEIINRDLQKKIQIYIGAEMECSEIEGCSLVVSRYKTDKGPSGRLAVLGPTRMNYSKVISALEYFSDLMNQIF